MARYNSSSGSTTINGTATIASPFQGAFTNLSGAAPYTVTLPNPGLFPGSNQTFYNATSGTVTLSTPSGVFSGTGASGTGTNSIFTGNVLSVTSDGTNYVVISEDGSPLIATTGSFSSDVTITGASATVNIQPSSLTLYPGSIGAMDRVAIGVNNRSSGAFTTLAANAAVTFTANTASSSTSTGTLVVTGGIGASGNIWSGGTVNANSVVATGLTGTLQTAAQANVTSLGTITSLSAGTISATGSITSTSNAPFSLQSNGNTGTYTQTVIYNNQNNTSGDSANGIFIERGRVTESASGEIRNFVIGARGGQIQLLVNKDGNIGLTGFTSPAYTLDFGATRPNYKGLIRTYGTGNFFTGIGMDTTTAGIRIAGDNAGGNLITDFGWYTNDAGQTWTSLLKILGNGNVGIGTNVSPAARLHVVNSSVSGIGSVPSGTSALIDSSSFNYLTFRSSADNATNAGLAFQDNNIGGYVVFRNYDGANTSISDRLFLAGYQGVNIQYGTADSIDVNARTTVARFDSNGLTVAANRFAQGAEYESTSRSGETTISSVGYKELFRLSSSRLGCSGFFSICATRGNYVTTSQYAFSGSHNYQGTITQLSSSSYTNVNVNLDVNSSGEVIVSIDWGLGYTASFPMDYTVTVIKTQGGGAINFASAGADRSSVPDGYQRRFSFTSQANGLRAENAYFSSLGKGSGSFKIDHPLPELTDTRHLVHSFIEGPKADLIYRGVVDLVAGKAEINIDTESDMTEGTFEALCRTVQCFTSNETEWSAVKGKVTGNILKIECQDTASTATISWMVIGERKDKHMYDTEWTDDDGKVIVEPLKNPIQTDFPVYPENVEIFDQSATESAAEENTISESTDSNI